MSLCNRDIITGLLPILNSFLHKFTQLNKIKKFICRVRFFAPDLCYDVLMSNYKRYYNTSSATVFITFVTYNRKSILLPNINILRNAFKYAKEKFTFNIIAITIMKNHCHLIISTNNPNDIPKIVRTIKFNFTVSVSEQFITKDVSISTIKRGEKGIWQRRYYDHIIRNEEDLNKHIDYIHFNSTKHYNIPPKDWQYSSFKKFVKAGYYDINWGDYKDVEHIKNMNLE